MGSRGRNRRRAGKGGFGPKKVESGLRGRGVPKRVVSHRATHVCPDREGTRALTGLEMLVLESTLYLERVRAVLGGTQGRAWKRASFKCWLRLWLEGEA